MSPITVLIVDDHASARAAVRAVLELEEDLHVVGEADNGLTALRAVRNLAPDVVLMDHHMPLADGVETTRQVTAHWPDVSVIFLTGEEDGRLEAHRAGAEAYLLKDTPPELLIATIRGVVHRRRQDLAPSEPSLFPTPVVATIPG